MMTKQTYYMPPVSMIGPCVLQDVGPEIRSMGCRKALLVTDDVLVKSEFPPD